MRGGLDRPAVDEDRQGGQHAAPRRRRGARRSIRRSRAACADARGGRPGRHPTRRGDCRAERATPSGSSSRARAAASSMASGRPSRRRQISTMASALSSVKREVVADGLGPIDEQRTAGNEPSSLDRRSLRGRRHRQRADGVLALGPKPQHGAARREDLRAPGSGPAAASRSGATLHDLLEVVQHEQGRRVRERARPGRRGRAPALDDQRPTAAAMRGSTSSGSGDRGRAARTRVPCGVAIVQPLAHGDRQPRLADAAGTGEGDEPDVRPSRAASTTASDVLPRARSRSSTVTGSERGRRWLSSARRRMRRSAAAAAKRSLRSRARSSRTSRPSSRGVLEGAVGVGPLALELADHGRQPGLPVGRRRLDVQQPGHRVGEPELVLESRRCPCPARPSRTAASTGR